MKENQFLKKRQVFLEFIWKTLNETRLNAAENNLKRADELKQQEKQLLI